MNPSYRPTHRTQVVIQSGPGVWEVELTEAGGRVGRGDGILLSLAIERAERQLYGW